MMGIKIRDYVRSKNICFLFVIVAYHILFIEIHLFFTMNQDMSSLMKKTEPQVVIGLVAQAKHNECFILVKPSGCPA